jgi:hypothetical protein
MSAARNFVQRPSRYIFQTSDSSLVRFAPMETRGISARAIIRDLSESGLSFTLPITEAIETLPEEGAPLKVEFPIPGRDQIACFATVMRVEQRTEWVPEWGDRGFHLIALQFRHLPTLHLRAIKTGLQGRVEDEVELSFSSIRRSHAIAFGGISLALIVTMFAMTAPLELFSHLMNLR